MFKIILVALALQLRFGPMLERPPDLHGLSTWYGPPGFCQGDRMANGEPLDLHAPTVAVDLSHRRWLGRDALVLTECGGLHQVGIADLGRLYEVGGWLRKGIRDGQLQYWPVAPYLPCEGEPVLLTPVLEARMEWLEERAYQVVADFPTRYYARVAACRVDAWGRGDTQKVMLWVLQ